jgi:hypothetical protein
VNMFELLLGGLASVVLIAALPVGLSLAARGESVDGRRSWLEASVTIVCLILFIPWTVGEYSRGEISPLPWQVLFTKWDGGSIDSFAGAVFDSLRVLVVNVYVLFVPAGYWIASHGDTSSRERYIARLINVLAGLLLLIPGSPVFALLNWLLKQNSVDVP